MRKKRRDKPYHKHIPHTGVTNIKNAGLKDNPEALITSSQEQMLRSMSHVGTSEPRMELWKDGKRSSKVVENELMWVL